MAIQAGQMLLHYRLVEQIGEGGMGVVWKAVDTTLDRDVAIKILPDAFAGDADRLARFEREAKLLAALNHNNIAAVYGFHRDRDLSFIAMELVGGETLAEMLRRSGASKLPVVDILEICRQIAEALEAAHDRGIVHRDLKPANVKIRPDGTVKVLDFGLARATPEESRPGSDPDAATATAMRTTPGVVLGTVPYMSPEQARGIAVDKRADIWALGCILYESLTGSRPFEGATTTDTLARIVSEPPDLGALPRQTPGFVIGLLRRCLEKDPRRRLRDAGELRVAIDEYQSNPQSAVVGTVDEQGRRSRPVALVPWLLAVLLGIALIYTLSPRDPGPATSAAELSRWSIALPAGARLGLPGPGGRFDSSRLVAISPDGRRIAYGVQDEQREVQLYLREIDSAQARPVPGTENARAPFFSPDGQWLGFYNGDKLHKVALGGGSPQLICDLGRVLNLDASWSPDGQTVVFATDDGLFRVAAAGGEAEVLTVPDRERGEVGHHAPRITADGRRVLFTVSVTPDTHLALLSLESRTWKILVRNASHGLPVGEDRIVFARSGELLAAPYDAASETVGAAVPVLQGVHTSPGLGGLVLTHFDVSDTGTLIYVPGSAEETADQLLWVDLEGGETPIASGVGTWVHPRLSPDGGRISLDIHTPDGMRDVYVYELSHGQMRRLTKTGITWESEWRPDGERIAILSGSPAGQWSLFWIRSDFGGSPELLLQWTHAVPADWLPDGRSLLFHDLLDGGIYEVSAEGDGRPEVVLRSSLNERFPRLSPDGRWIAYVGDEPGRHVFVQSFPELGPKHKISIDGGGEPSWSPDGRRIYFREGDGMLVVDVEYQPSFRAGKPRVLFTGNYDAAPLSGHQHYDVSNDGERFLMVRHGDASGPSRVDVVLHWSETLRQIE